jgi:C-terminal processing protease CtpA/Prc
MRTFAAAVASLCFISPALADPHVIRPRGLTRVIRLSDGDEPGRLGVVLQGIGEDLRRFFGAPADSGVLVSKVVEGSPAAKAGIRVGDVITEADGVKLDDPDDLVERVQDKKKGASIQLALVRDKKNVTLTSALRDPDPNAKHSEFSWDDRNGAVRVFRHEFDGVDGEKIRKQIEVALSDPALKKQLEETQAQLRALEKRLDKLESSHK